MGYVIERPPRTDSPIERRRFDQSIYDALTKGGGIASMTIAQRDTLVPFNGMLIYNLSTNKLNLYTTAWNVVDPTGVIPSLLTDAATYVYPALEPMSAIGDTSVDPVFGTTILQITDGTIGANCTVPYSLYPTFNSNNTYLYLRNGNAAEIFTFDPVAMTSAHFRTVSDPPFPPAVTAQWYGMQWSGTNPSIIYLNGNLALWSYNVVTDTYTQLRDFTAEITTAPADYIEQMTKSLDDNVFAFSYGAGGHVGYMVWKRNTNTILVSVMDPTSDEVHIDKTGRYLTVQGSGTPRIIDLSTMGITQLTRYDTGDGFYHSAEGTATIFAGDGPTNGLGYRQAATPHSVTTTLEGLFNFANMNYTLHANDEGWALVWTQRDDALTITAAYQNELLLVATDGSDRVKRICHHRSVWHEYDDQPNATISRDGAYAAFTSNWGDSGRRDVFVVRMSV